MLEIIISIIVVLFVTYLIVKKTDSVLALSLGGFILLAIAAILGHDILNEKLTTGYAHF